MRSVYQAENIIDAQLVKDALESAGIPAFITGAALTGAMGELPVMGLIEVQVPDSAVDAAQPVVAEIDEWLSQRPQDGPAIDDAGWMPEPA
ncbi:MAG: DUF2007 domain-containing protein [Lysobacterales bacterium]|nr:DUF2007 domain-containing protein [Xanthomonadales bacterium]MCB1611800.1 DUF2007 domain-containing protein [Xanthomonadales bacterium]MCP5475919.1 DUF2007 domain-containing protein [Rhodanobacteraceae bacterium]